MLRLGLDVGFRLPRHQGPVLQEFGDKIEAVLQGGLAEAHAQLSRVSLSKAMSSARRTLLVIAKQT